MQLADFSGCGARARGSACTQLWHVGCCGAWDLGSPAQTEPVSPALENGLLTTGPPGKSPTLLNRLCVPW